MAAPQEAPRAHATRILHSIHAVPSVDPLRLSYQRLFGGLVFCEEYHAGEDRDMALLYVADHMIEPMAPRRPDSPETIFSRYLAKYGPGWHSLAFGTDDAAAASRRVKAAGARLTTDYPGPPGFFFVHPETTGGIVVEVTDYPMRHDPYDEPSWNADWAGHRRHMPRRLRYPVCVVRDLAAAVHFFTVAMDGALVESGEQTWPQPARSARISIGDGQILLLAPTGDQGPLSDALAGPFSGLYALAWDVADIGALTDWCAEFGETVVAGPDGAELVLQGARHWFLPPAA